MGTLGKLLKSGSAQKHCQRGIPTLSNQLTPIALMAKADRACLSARALLNLGDVDGACNRAYYAMFDAARAALLASGSPVRPDIGKTHSGLINTFSEHLIKNGPVPKELGRL